MPQGVKGLNLYELFPGVHGYAMEHEGWIYCPIVIATNPGNGDVSKFLDEVSSLVVFPCVISEKFQAMLERRGYEQDIEWDPREQEEYPVWRKQIAKAGPEYFSIRQDQAGACNQAKEAKEEKGSSR